MQASQEHLKSSWSTSGLKKAISFIEKVTTGVWINGMEIVMNINAGISFITGAMLNKYQLFHSVSDNLIVMARASLEHAFSPFCVLHISHHCEFFHLIMMKRSVVQQREIVDKQVTDERARYYF